MNIYNFTEDKYLDKPMNKQLYDKGLLLVEDVIKEITYTKPGSLIHLLHGRIPSTHSSSVKFGKWGEKWFVYAVESTPNFSMLPHGVLKGIGEDGKSKDIDFLFRDDINMIVYYRELKGNINLDTEKLPATHIKINYLKEYLEIEYPNYSLNSGLLNWSVWDRKPYEEKGNRQFLNKIKTFENSGVTVTHASEMFEILGMDVNEEDYYQYFNKIGKVIVEATN
jgi:hypothetical protein